MEEPEDPQVPIPTEAAEVKRPADPNIPSKSIAIPVADQSQNVDQGKIRPPPLQKHSDTSPSDAPPPPLQIEHPTLHSSETATAAVLNEDRIELTRDMSINPADVLSGRGKQAFNHGTFFGGSEEFGTI